jgi:hypothetical protein
MRSFVFAAVCVVMTGCIDPTPYMVHDDDRNTPRYKKDVREYERQGYTRDQAKSKADNDVLWQNWDRYGCLPLAQCSRFSDTQLFPTWWETRSSMNWMVFLATEIGSS